VLVYSKQTPWTRWTQGGEETEQHLTEAMTSLTVSRPWLEVQALSIMSRISNWSVNLTCFFIIDFLSLIFYH
jgi:hypothetical protein